MKQFKRLMMSFHMKDKSCLNRLYVDKQVYLSSVSSSEQPVEEEKIYFYRELAFQFMGTGFRTPQNLIMFVFIPERMISCDYPVYSYAAAYEDYLLRLLSDGVNDLSEEYRNDKKSAREKAQLSMQPVSSMVQRRNGCIYIEEKQAFRLRIHFQVPLLNGKYVNGKAGFKAVREALSLILDRLEQIEKEDLKDSIRLYLQQLEIRKYLKEHDFIAFVADGSILPREGGSELPAKRAVPFVSPEALKIHVPLPDGEFITGMGIRKGVTVITGGGYSGKSTLLNSIEMGIYYHRRGDGREYVITEDTACKIYAEDGRYIENMDISPFFSYMPGSQDVTAFSSKKASGSVSQAVNIIEAVYGGSRVLLIDEDTSATNFMIRDGRMRRLVKNEPITPFTDRILELKDKGISTILVIGGSSEYLKYADSVVLMEDYTAEEKTEYVRECLCEGYQEKQAQDAKIEAQDIEGKAQDAKMEAQDIEGKTQDAKMEAQDRKVKAQKNTQQTKNIEQKAYHVAWQPHQWTQKRYLQMPATEPNKFFYSECVEIENARYIKINQYTADITKMTAIISEGQINSLAWLLEKIFMETEEKTDLLDRCAKKTKELIASTMDAALSNTHKYELQLEMIRPIDLMMAVSRVRGLKYRK